MMDARVCGASVLRIAYISSPGLAGAWARRWWHGPVALCSPPLALLALTPSRCPSNLCGDVRPPSETRSARPVSAHPRPSDADDAANGDDESMT